MTVSYSTNWMGPVSTHWYKERGLTIGVCEKLPEDQRFLPKGLKAGDWWCHDEITTNYSCGRIDIRDDTKEGYDGWDEYSVAPMRSEDWAVLSEWLWNLTTTEKWDYEMLISIFEGECLGREIRWWKEQE